MLVVGFIRAAAMDIHGAPQYCDVATSSIARPAQLSLAIDA